MANPGRGEWPRTGRIFIGWQGCQPPPSAPKVAIEKLDDHIQSIPGFRDIHVVKESVKQPFPDVELRLHASFYQLFVRIESGAQFNAGVPVIIRVGGNFDKTLGVRTGATSGSFESVPAK